MVYDGVAGSVKTGATESAKTIAHMSDWSLELSRDIKEGSFFGGDGYKEKKAGIKDWSASFSGVCDFVTDTSQKELLDKFESGEEITCNFYLNDTTYFSGNGIIESLTIDNNAEDGPNIDISVAGTKGVTSTIPAQSQGQGG